MNILEYKGYRAAVEFDAKNYTLIGKVMRINEDIQFSSENILVLEQEFHHAMDAYLDKCARQGMKPEREYKGTFNIRITPELHARMAELAHMYGISLNATVEKAIERYVEEHR